MALLRRKKPLIKRAAAPAPAKAEELMHLSKQIGVATIRRESVRAGFGRGLVRLAETDDKIVGLSADLAESVGMQPFVEAFPERYIEVGVAEQNLATVASGVAAMGWRSFAASYGAFSPGRNWEQIRTTICLNERPVVLVGSHAGLSVGPDGATHQVLEDIAMMRSLPGMTVVAPADSIEAEKAVLALGKTKNPAYLRLSRDSTPVFTTILTPFTIGKAYVLRSGSDVTICATGTMTYRALMAARQLSRKGVSVELVHVPTIKPLDIKTIVDSAKKTGRVVTVEDGQVAAGFGGAVAEVLGEHMPNPLKRLGMQDQFGQSGSSDVLYEAYGLDAAGIAQSVLDFVKPESVAALKKPKKRRTR